MTEIDLSKMTASTAKGQRCLYCGAEYPLFPPILHGCPQCMTDDFKAPLELTYDYPDNTDWLPSAPLPGLTRYAPILPPLGEHVSMGEGGTPLIACPPNILDGKFELYIKDESRNPTWSHKDRLNLCVTSTAIAMGDPGIVAASSGNHGAACAAYAARAGLPAIIFCTPRPPAVESFLNAFGQMVVAVPEATMRWTLMQRVIEELKYHPASNFTDPPTNHPFGSEGYKTIAYEIVMQLDGRAPEAVFVPVGYAELTFGVFKGFKEMVNFGLIPQIPHIIGCEPAAGAPLKRAVETGQRIARVDVDETDAYAIAVPVNSYRGVVAIRESEGHVLAITEQEMREAQATLGKTGIWSEISSVISFAGALRASELPLTGDGPLVAINTSNGFKDNGVGHNPIPLIDGSWEALQALLN
jgi:threonine synthase